MIKREKTDHPCPLLCINPTAQNLTFLPNAKQLFDWCLVQMAIQDINQILRGDVWPKITVMHKTLSIKA